MAPDAGSAAARALVRAAAILGMSSLPLTTAVQAHVVLFPPPWRVVARAALAVAALGALVLLAWRAVAKSWDAATVAAVFWLASFAAYPALIPPDDGRVAGVSWLPFVYLAAATAPAALLARRSSASARRLVQAAAVISVVIVAVAMAQIAGAFVHPRPSVTFPRSLLDDGPAAIESPDVYHIVLDGFGRPDVLRALYRADLSGFVEALRARGFDVPENSVANYVQTYLSIASMLNADYLTPLARDMGDRQSREPLHELIQSSVVFRDLKRLGYDIVFLGSPYSATFAHRQADTCICGVPLAGEFEATLIERTPARDLPMGDFLYGAHRRAVVGMFSALRRLTPPGRPRVVFAHVMSPHPPFVLTRDGNGTTPRNAFAFWDGSMFRGSAVEYREGYSEQVQFLAREVLTVVDHVLREARRPMVIVIQGDHGPRYRFDQADATKTDALESVPILLAVRWAETPHATQAVTSPVNLYREFMRRYTNARPPLLEDASFVSSFSTPYRFLRFAPSAFRDAATRATEIR